MTLQTQIYNLVHDVLLGGPRTDRAGKIEGFSNIHEAGKGGGKNWHEKMDRIGFFRMPIHYPRYKKDDYEKMEEWKLDNLLQQYGLAFDGSLEEKRAYAMGAFLWPDQL
ncbi:hypothetical protein Pfo_013238 [Paulownia fortunei]|nr:hypothetical protein Pfo_013238 [Paulownia fortunei]